MNRPIVRDSALLLTRLVLGVIFISHGWDKLFMTGVEKTTGYFVAQGIPQAELTVWAVALLELIGGALLVLGLLAPATALIFIVEMLGAIWAVHWGHGLFIAQGGSEFVLAMISSLLLVVVFGAGKFSLDRLFVR